MSYLQKHVGFDFSLWNSDHTSGMFDREFLLSTRCFSPTCVCALLQWTLQYYFLQYAVNFSLSLFR